MTLDIQLESDNPLLDFLGVRMLDWQPGLCSFGLEIEPRHLNRTRSLHGGVIATLLDAACGYSGLYEPDDKALRHAVTIMLNIGYIGKVDEGRIKVTGRVTGTGHRIYFASAELWHESGKLVATAQGTFKRSSAVDQSRLQHRQPD
jgi:uncharacterized protein (TIGR00369 family)